MRLLFVTVKLKLRELFYNKVYLAVLLCLPILILVLGGYGLKNSEEAGLRAGIYVEEGTKLGVQMQEILAQDKSINFKVYTDENLMEEDVAKAKIECGFLIKKEIEALAAGDGKAAIEMIVSPSTVASGPIQETVGAAFFRLTAGDVAYATLRSKDYISKDSKMEEKIKERVESYYGEGDLMKVKLLTDGKEKKVGGENQSVGIYQLCKGFLGVFLFVSSLLLGAKIAGERKGAFYKRMKAARKWLGVIEYGNVIAGSLCQAIVGSLSYGILFILLRKCMDIHLIQELGMLVLYVAAMNVGMLWCTLWIKEEQIWLGLIPMLSIASVIFCPIVVDLSQMKTGLRYGSYLFMPYYYLTARIELLLIILVVSALGYLLMWKRYRQI